MQTFLDVLKEQIVNKQNERHYGSGHPDSADYDNGYESGSRAVFDYVIELLDDMQEENETILMLSPALRIAIGTIEELSLDYPLNSQVSKILISLRNTLNAVEELTI